MSTLRVLAWLTSLGLTITTAALAQDFPQKPVRIVTGEPGGSLGLLARLVAPALTSNLGQPIIVENRPAGVIIGNIVAKANPDGYTILLIGSSFWLAPFLQDNLPWDPVKDFAAVAPMGGSPLVFVVHPAVPAKTIKELIAVAKTQPGKLNYASGPSGAANHLSVELLKSMAGIDIVRIAYKGSGPALTALIGGQETQLMSATAAGVTPHIKAGRLRALAVTSAEPSALVPGLPTVAASGLPGYEMTSPYGIFAPVKTPAAVINRLNREIVKALNTAEVKEQFFNAGVEVSPGGPEKLAAAVSSERTRLGKLIKDLGIKEAD